jgi:hypothetical protein
MSPFPPLPAPHPVAYPLYLDGRAYATCTCHWHTPLTQDGELPRNARRVAQS